MGDVTVTLLGGFAAVVDGVPVPDTAWRLKKARELVKLLALAPGHRLHREQAMDVLWRDRGPAAAANNLHQAVHVARRALGADAIQLRDEVLTLIAEIDVDRLELAASEARRIETPAAYAAALSLYGGELLPENRYDDWAELRREELAALAAELAEESAALGSARTFGLPADASSFVGRGRELAELTSLLRRTRLLTLSGTGGVGKTRLALELARAAEPSYEAGAALVELAALADPRLVPDAVADALDVRALPSQELVDAVVDFLSPRTLLLVLDNCEHLLAATATLSDTLLRSAPRLTIVATSREPLRVPGEVVFRVPSLDIPDPEQPLPPGELLDYEAVSLFVERAAAAAPGFALDEENAEDVARICLRLDGLPLALELAAGRLGALSPTAIAERLDDRFRLLRTDSHAAPTRQQTLTATLQWSHDLLEPDERMLLRRLAIFAGGFELEAVEDVCAGDGLGASEIADVLARLVEKSLVAVEDRGRGRRYRLLETVRMYARDRLDDDAEAPALAGRHARWALALAERERESLQLDRDAPNLRAALDTLLRSEPRDALRLCVALSPFWLRRIELDEAKRRFAEALDAAPERTTLRAEALLAAAAIDFRSGTLSHGMTLAEQSHAVASEIGDTRTQWRALQFFGEFGIAGDAADIAVPWLERALALARSERFAAAEAIGVHSLGVAHWILGDLPTADRLLAESIEGFRALEGSAETIPSPLNIAEIRTHQSGGRPGLRHVFEDTLQPFVEISCDAAVSYALANQAGIARARGDLARAHTLLDESAARFEAARDDAGRATVLVRRAYISLVEGELAAARTHLEVALELRARLNDRRGLGLVLAGLGLIETTAGEYAGAERHLTEAHDIFRRAGDRWGLASTLWRLADLAFARGDLDAAETALQEAHAVLGETQRERWIATTLAGLAEVALLRGDVERACDLLADARDRYAARDDALGVANVEERLALLSER
ncbi:MAG TPA: tetratricopeptide repeat protein [Gaiellaceae bacterium]|nr:tetratricopeptide repeat protein [Gaiellaceae bacterium]